MILSKPIALLACAFLLNVNASAQSSKDSVYVYKRATVDGTGKFYMGREIAQVMGFEGAAWLERDTREEEENAKLAIVRLPLKPGDAVADIGAGTGYYTFPVAARLLRGRTYAVEVQQSAVDYLSKQAKERGLKNVVVIKGGPQAPNLPDNCIDLAFMVDVYHELAYPQQMLQAIRRALKPGGKLLLIEFKAEDPSINIKPLHKMSIAQAKKELGANGFKMISAGDFLPIQHFLLFQKN